MCFKKVDHIKKPTAKVKYVLKAVLHAAHKHDEMKYRQVLIIREGVSHVS
jgi:hypothetical protein